MAYEDLTGDEKQVLQTWVNFVRGWCSQQASAFNASAAIATTYRAQIAPIFAQLAMGDEIPNRSGLAGAQSLTKGDIAELSGLVNSMSGEYDTTDNREALVRACGINGIVG